MSNILSTFLHSKEKRKENGEKNRTGQERKEQERKS
jgi:hypothetical protein